jgi:hypothetical protein
MILRQSGGSVTNCNEKTCNRYLLTYTKNTREGRIEAFYRRLIVPPAQEIFFPVNRPLTEDLLKIHHRYEERFVSQPKNSLIDLISNIERHLSPFELYFVSLKKRTLCCQLRRKYWIVGIFQLFKNFKNICIPIF